MHTIDCRIKRDDYTDVQGDDVTPAEVLIIRKIWSKAAKGDPILNPVKKGVALRNGQPRTDREEHQRLRLKYPGKNPKTDMLIVEEVLGNEYQALPQTFADLEVNEGAMRLEIADPKKVSAEDKSKPEVTWGSGATDAPGEGANKSEPGESAPEKTLDEKRAALLGHSKAELVKFAKDCGADVTEEDTKATLAEKILVETGEIGAG